MKTATRRATVYGGKLIPWYTAGGAPTPIAAYQPKGAASLAASRINLANPGTYDAADGVAPTFDASTGWTFDGIGQWLDTGIVPAAGWTMIVRFSDAASGTLALAGAYTSGTTEMGFLPRYATGVFYANGGGVGVSPGLTAGVLAVAGQNGYRNGALDTASIPAWSGTNTRAIAIGAENANGTISRFQGCKIQALAIYNSTLTPAQVAAVSAAMAAL